MGGITFLSLSLSESNHIALSRQIHKCVLSSCAPHPPLRALFLSIWVQHRCRSKFWAQGAQGGVAVVFGNLVNINAVQPGAVVK